MKDKWIVLLVMILGLTSGGALAQKQVWLHGKVVNSMDGRPIPLAQIASYKKLHLFAADSLGGFKVILDSNDSIKVVALGFDSRVFHLDSLDVDADKMYRFPLKATSYQIKQVDVNSNWHYSNYLARRSVMRSKQKELNLMLPSDIKLGKKPDIPADIQPAYSEPPPIYAAALQPLSYMHYYTSKSERRKVKYLKLLEEEKQRTLLTVDLMKEISGLEGDELQKFIIYCNANIKLNKKDTALTVKYKVIDLFDEYKSNSNND